MEEKENNVEITEKKNNNVALYIVVVGIVLLVGMGIGYYLYKNKPEKPVDNPINNNDVNKEKTSDIIDFPEVKLSKLSEVKDYFFEGDIENFSKWYLLDEDANYVTLIGGMNFKISSNEALIYKQDDSFWEKYGIDFGKDGFERLLNEQDLKKYFECDLGLMKCGKTGISTLTSVRKDNGVIELDGKNLSIFEFDIGLSLASPIIKILKSNFNNSSANGISFPVENGYTEVTLNSTQKKEINDKLLVFNVENSWTLFPNFYTENIGDDLFASDCNKAKVALNYVYAQFFKQIKDTKYPWSDYYKENGNEHYMDVNKVKSLAGIFFNKTIICNEEPFDKNYVDEELAEGGWAGQLLKTVSKYQNGNNYYLILHLYDLDGTEECLKNSENLNECYASDDDKAKTGYYFKLKYYKDDIKEYIISLEYLK